MESFGLFFCNVWNDGIALLLGLVGGCFGELVGIISGRLASCLIQIMRDHFDLVLFYILDIKTFDFFFLELNDDGRWSLFE